MLVERPSGLLFRPCSWSADRSVSTESEGEASPIPSPPRTAARPTQGGARQPLVTASPVLISTSPARSRAPRHGVVLPWAQTGPTPPR